MAKAECQDPRNIGAWLPLLRSLLPGLIAQCHPFAVTDAVLFVAEQLGAHMLEGDYDQGKSSCSSGLLTSLGSSHMGDP